MKVTSTIPDVVNRGEFFDVIIEALNDGTEGRTVARLGCFPDKREGQVEYAIANIAELVSDDPAPDSDVDAGQLAVVGNYAEFYVAGTAKGVKKIAPGESVKCKFRVAILSGTGSTPHNTNEHYIQGHLIETNLTSTSPMVVSYVHERLNAI